MRFALDDSQRALQDAVRAYLDNAWDAAALRSVVDGDRSALGRVEEGLHDQLGLGQMSLAVARGLAADDGSEPDASWVELCVVLEELGRSYYAGTFAASAVIGLHALALSDRVPVAALEEVADGHVVVGVGSFDDLAGLRADHDGGGCAISGALARVVDGAGADLVVTAAHGPEGPVLVSLPGRGVGITVEALLSSDPTRSLAAITYDRVAAEVLLDAREFAAARPALGRTTDLVTAADQVGIADRCLASSLAHVATRTQFGRPVGSFQAVKHRAADTLVGLRAARALMWHAAWSVAHDEDDGVFRAAAARRFADQTAIAAAAANIQLHGGIGFTWEHDAHIAYKRALAGHRLHGGPTRAQAVILAAKSGLSTPTPLLEETA